MASAAIREHGKTTKLFGAFEDITANHKLTRHEARLAMVAGQMTMALIQHGSSHAVKEAIACDSEGSVSQRR